MAIVSRGWLPTNEQRAYPVHERATCMADNGTRLPDDILVDAHIHLPTAAGLIVRVSSIAVTAKLVTVTLVAASDYPTDMVVGGGTDTPTVIPLASVHVQRPVTPYASYNIDPIYPGVKGWVAFGTGTEKYENLNLFFSVYDAAWLVDRCVRRSNGSSSAYVGKVGLATRLYGLVRLTGSSNVETYKDTRSVSYYGTPEVAVIALKATVGETNTTMLRRYSGTCKGRPSEGTCVAAALQSICGVKPDRNGNIDFIFTGANEIVGDSGDGLVLDYPLGLADACPAKDYAPYDPDDPCEESSSSSSSESSSSSSSSSNSSSYVPEPSSSSYCSSLDSEYGRLEPVLETGMGNWEFAEDDEGHHRLTSVEGDFLPSLVVSMDRYSIENNGEEAIVSSIIRPTQTPMGEGHLVFSYKNDDNFYFAGLTFRPSGLYPRGRFFIGRKTASGGGWTDGLGSGYHFLASFEPGISLQEADYTVEARIKRYSSTTAGVTLEVIWTDPGSGVQVYVSPEYPVLDIATTSFNVGLGCVSSPGTEFADWCAFGLQEKRQ